MFSDTIRNYFDRYGWLARKVDENWVVTSFLGEDTILGLSAGLMKGWFTVLVNTFITVKDVVNPELLCLELLVINYQEESFRFAVNENNYIVLRSDHPLDGDLTYSAFEAAINEITHQTIKYSREIEQFKGGIIK